MSSSDDIHPLDSLSRQSSVAISYCLRTRSVVLRKGLLVNPGCWKLKPKTGSNVCRLQQNSFSKILDTVMMLCDRTLSSRQVFRDYAWFVVGFLRGSFSRNIGPIAVQYSVNARGEAAESFKIRLAGSQSYSFSILQKFGESYDPFGTLRQVLSGSPKPFRDTF